MSVNEQMKHRCTKKQGGKADKDRKWRVKHQDKLAT